MKKTNSMAILLASAWMSPMSLEAFKSRTAGGNAREITRDADYWKPNGARECARRRRQIASGQLTEPNGLVR